MKSRVEEGLDVERVAFGVRSVVAEVTTVWMDTTSTAVRIDVVKEVVSAGEARDGVSRARHR